VLFALEWPLSFDDSEATASPYPSALILDQAQFWLDFPNGFKYFT
jgi:hypothetical protein